MPDLCPECSRTLPKNPKAACRCGWAPTPETASRRDRQDYRCQWTTSGRQCRLPGQLARGDPMLPNKKFYCDWHDTCLHLTGGAQWADNRYEWDAWREQMRKAGYCADVVHLPADWQWSALLGQEPRGVPVREGCDRGYPYCQWAARPADLGPPVTTPEVAFARLKALTALIGDL